MLLAPKHNYSVGSDQRNKTLAGSARELFDSAGKITTGSTGAADRIGDSGALSIATQTVATAARPRKLSAATKKLNARCLPIRIFFASPSTFVHGLRVLEFYLRCDNPQLLNPTQSKPNQVGVNCCMLSHRVTTCHVELISGECPYPATKSGSYPATFFVQPSFSISPLTDF